MDNSHTHPADVYAGTHRHALVGGGTTLSRITLANTQAWPADAPDHRFFVVGTPVTWACLPNHGRLERISKYGWLRTQPTSVGQVSPLGASPSRHLLIDQVVACNAALSHTLSQVPAIEFDLTVGSATENITFYVQALLNRRP
jgi:hypothetical protein